MSTDAVVTPSVMASFSSSSWFLGSTLWALSFVFDDIDDLGSASEAVLVLGPQLASHVLVVMFAASFCFLIVHVCKYSDRSMLLRALKKAIGWEEDASFMPYYATSSTKVATTSAGTRPTDAEVRRAKTLREVERLKAALLGLHDTESLASSAATGAVTEGRSAPPRMPTAATGAVVAPDASAASAGAGIAGLEEAWPPIAVGGTDGGEGQGIRRRMSAREELLRRRGTSLASACRLLDESMHEFHAGDALGSVGGAGSGGGRASSMRSGTVQLFGRKLASGAVSSPTRSPVMADGSPRMQRQQSYRHHKYL